MAGVFHEDSKIQGGSEDNSLGRKPSKFKDRCFQPLPWWNFSFFHMETVKLAFSIVFTADGVTISEVKRVKEKGT